MTARMNVFLDSATAMDALAGGMSEVFALSSREGAMDLPDGRLRQLANPWQFVRQDERAETSYLLARAYAGKVAPWLERDVADAVVHDWMYFFGEDVVAAGFAVRAILDATPSDQALVVHHKLSGIFQRLASELLCRSRPNVASAAIVERAETPGAPKTPQVRPPAPLLSGSPSVLIVELYANRLPHLLRTADATGVPRNRIAVLNLATRDSEFSRIAAFCDEQRLGWLDWRAHARTPRSIAAAMPAAAGLAHVLGRQRSLSAALGAYLQAPVPRWCDRAARAALLKSIVRMYAVRGVLSAVFDECKPAVVMSARSDDTIMRVMGRVCESRGIVYLDLQHGIRNGSPSPLLRDIHGVELCLAGETTVERYVDAGADPARVHRTGTPFYDHLADDSELTLPNGVNGRPFVVYSSALVRIHKRYLPELPHLRVLQGLDEFLESCPDACVVLKPHPQEDSSDTTRTVATMRNADRVFIAAGLPNAPLFRAARAHVSIGSTTSLEAALLGARAVMMTEGDASRSFDDAIELGAISRVESPSELANALIGVFSAEDSAVDIERNREVDRLYAFGADGKASQRIAGLSVVQKALSGAR